MNSPTDLSTTNQETLSSEEPINHDARETDEASIQEDKDPDVENTPAKYEIFISYRWGDKERKDGCTLASGICEFLKRKNHTVYLDIDTVNGSQEQRDNIRALEESKVVILLVDNYVLETTAEDKIAEELELIKGYYENHTKEVLPYNIDKSYKRQKGKEKKENKYIDWLDNTRLFPFHTGDEIFNSKELLNIDVELALWRASGKAVDLPTPDSQKRKRNEILRLATIAAIAFVILATALASMFPWSRQGSPVPQAPTSTHVIYAGGGGTANMIDSLYGHPLDNTTYIHLPSEAAWYLLADYEFKTNKDTPGYEVALLSSEKISEKEFVQKTHLDDSSFKAHGWRIVEYLCGHAQLQVIIYPNRPSVLNSLNIDPQKTTITPQELLGLLNNEQLYVLATDDLSGTLNEFSTALHIDRDSLIKLRDEKFTVKHDNDSAYLKSRLDKRGKTRTGVIALCNEWYHPPLPNDTTSFIRLSLAEDGKGIIHQDLYIYTLAEQQKRNSDNYYILSNVYDFLKVCGYNGNNYVYDGSNTLIVPTSNTK